MNEEIVITSKKRLLDLQLKKVIAYRSLLYMLVKRDFITYYKQTILGPLWYLVQPICSTIMFAFVFGNLAKIGTNSIPLALFYFSGTMLWELFTTNLTKASTVFISNKDLFGKVYFPRIIVPISNVISALFKMGIQFVLFIVIYMYYLLRGGVIFQGFRILLIFPVIIWISSMAIGTGMIVTSITTKYRDIAMALNFFVSLLMYATPVVYPLSEVNGKMKVLLCLNPMSAPLEVFRYAFFGMTTIPIWSVVYSIVFMIVMMFFGLIVFNQNERTFIDVI